MSLWTPAPASGLCSSFPWQPPTPAAPSPAKSRQEPHRGPVAAGQGRWAQGRPGCRELAHKGGH